MMACERLSSSSASLAPDAPSICNNQEQVKEADIEGSIAADLVEVLLLLGAVIDGSADDLLRKGAAHDGLHGRRLLALPKVLVHKVLIRQHLPSAKV